MSWKKQCEAAMKKREEAIARKKKFDDMIMIRTAFNSGSPTEQSANEALRARAGTESRWQQQAPTQQARPSPLSYGLGGLFGI